MQHTPIRKRDARRVRFVLVLWKSKGENVSFNFALPMLVIRNYVLEP